MSQVAISGNASGTGTLTIAAPNTNSNYTLTLPTATTTIVGTDATQTLTNKTIQGGAITSGTAVASTSGTSIDFTGIPSWVKRITVMFQGVSASGTSGWLVQIGGASIETSGYVSSATFTGAGSGGTSSTAGFFALPTAAGTATNIYTGMVTLALLDSATNTWLHQTIAGLTQSGTVYSIQGGGSKAITGALARVRITTVNGTDTFDAGTINIMYEG